LIQFASELEARNGHHRVAALLLPLFLTVLSSSTTLAQNQAPSAAPSSEQLLKPEQLDALVAPIALYPDNLLLWSRWHRPIRWRSYKLTAGQGK
jgi:hypothetical protein